MIGSRLSDYLGNGQTAKGIKYVITEVPITNIHHTLTANILELPHLLSFYMKQTLKNMPNLPIDIISIPKPFQIKDDNFILHYAIFIHFLEK